MKENIYIYFDRVKSLEISFLQEMYSPMFDKKFSEMTDDEIRRQLDLWLDTNEHKEIFEPRKPLTKEDREKNFRKFIGGKGRWVKS